MGQHRDHGRPDQPQQTVRPDLDLDQRAAARRLQIDFPGWIILWSYGQRRFHAYPCWEAPVGLVLTDTDPDRLGHALRTVRHQHPGPMDPLTPTPLPAPRHAGQS